MVGCNVYPGFDEDINRYNISNEVKSRIALLLRTTRAGSDEVFTTPIVKNVKPDVILAEIDELFKANSSAVNDTLRNLEMMNRDKFGPRSIASPWSDRVKTINESFETHDTIGKIEHLTSLGRLKPIDVSNAILKLKNNTSSGLPSLEKKRLAKKTIKEEFDAQLNMKYPCMLYTRTQESGKTRNVWGFPISDTLNEMRYYIPLLVHQRKLPYRCALHEPNYINEKISQLILRCNSDKSMCLISIDFSAYDASVKSELQDLSFEYIKSCFQDTERQSLDYIAHRFKTIPIWTPDGIKEGEHGVPSGSTFTNEVDSIAQATIAVNKAGLNVDDFQVQGDDGVYLIKESMRSELYKHFQSYGLSVNLDKSYCSKDFVVYLQNLYHSDYMKNGKISGIYPIYRALNRILFQERWQNFEDFDIMGKDYYSIRTICILENCKNHPLFEKFVNIILKYDKYSLDFSDQGLSGDRKSVV